MLIVFQLLQVVGYYGFTSWVPTLLLAQGITVTRRSPTRSSSPPPIRSAHWPRPGSPIAASGSGSWRFPRSAIAVFGLVFSQQTLRLGIMVVGTLIAFSNTVLAYSLHAYQSELYPTRIRARAVGFTYSWSRFSTVFVGFIIAWCLQELRHARRLHLHRRRDVHRVPGHRDLGTAHDRACGWRRYRADRFAAASRQRKRDNSLSAASAQGGRPPIRRREIVCKRKHPGDSELLRGTQTSGYFAFVAIDRASGRANQKSGERVVKTHGRVAGYTAAVVARTPVASLSSGQGDRATKTKLLLGTVAAVWCGLCGAAPAWSAPGYTFTTLSLPGAAAGDFIFGSDINDQGQIVVSATVPGVSFDFTAVDDLYNMHTGTYTPIPAYPGSTANSTEAFSINNAGQIVGEYHTAGIAWGGFLLSGGSFSSVTYPAGSTYSYPIDIGNNGQIVGSYLNSSNVLNGYTKSGSTYTGTAVPAAWGYGGLPNGVNKFGTIVGQYLPTGAPLDYNFAESFIDAGGTYTQVAGMPGFGWTELYNINDLGQMIGIAYNDPVSGVGTGFVYEGGTYVPFNDPLGVGGTSPYGINNHGAIVGTYVDANGNEQAFLAVPTPEPSALLPLVTGLAGLGFVRRRR